MGKIVYNWIVIKRNIIILKGWASLIKIKKNINKDAEKKYEYRFYRYLGLVLIILFSCIVTVSNLINPGETKKLISELVRKDYSDFFQYELQNSDKSLQEIYDSYSKNENIEVYKLMALNTIYLVEIEIGI